MSLYHVINAWRVHEKNEEVFQFVDVWRKHFLRHVTRVSDNEEEMEAISERSKCAGESRPDF